MTDPTIDREQQGCVILTFSGCSLLIGFLIGLATIIIWEALG